MFAPCPCQYCFQRLCVPSCSTLGVPYLILSQPLPLSHPSSSPSLHSVPLVCCPFLNLCVLFFLFPLGASFITRGHTLLQRSLVGLCLVQTQIAQLRNIYNSTSKAHVVSTLYIIYYNYASRDIYKHFTSMCKHGAPHIIYILVTMTTPRLSLSPFLWAQVLTMGTFVILYLNQE